jgi:hypothetical protein
MVSCTTVGPKLEYISAAWNSVTSIDAWKHEHIQRICISMPPLLFQSQYHYILLKYDQQDATFAIIFYFSQFSALHVSGVLRPSSGAHKNCKHSIRYCRAFLLPGASATVPDAVFTVLLAPDDGRKMPKTCRAEH